MVKHVKLVNEFIITLLEAESDVRYRPNLSRDSVDDQIDSILLGYESDCIVAFNQATNEEIPQGATGNTPVGESMKRLYRMYLLKEAPDDDDDPTNQTPELGQPTDAPPPATPDESDEEKKKKEVEAQTGDVDNEPDIESDPLQPKLDLKLFAFKVSQLVSSHLARLDVPIVIVNRAKNYLKQNYSEALAEEFAEIMERDHKIKVEKEDPTTPRQIPMAAGAAGTGLAGG